MEIEQIIKTLTIVIGLYMAWNIGANDVANAMGTSVGSKALTLAKAVILAAILEFSGAFFLGGNVSKTIQGGIVDPSFFQNNPLDYALGMIAALLSCAIWLNIASFLRLPVSTTHAIIGAIIGFGLVAGGVHAIMWKEFFTIALSWLISPLISGLIAYFTFHFLQKRVFFSFHPLRAVKNIAPFFVFLMVGIFVFSLLYDKIENGLLWLAIPSIAAFLSLSFYLFIKKISPPTDDNFELCIPPQKIVYLEKAQRQVERLMLSSSGTMKNEFSLMKDKLDDLSSEIHAKKEIFHTSAHYMKVEKIFSYLQIMSASFIAFAHGSNDVANAIGPVSAVFHIISTKSLILDGSVPMWILLLGAIGIVIGLASWGWRVIETIGKKITELTPSRGFSAEFGSALTILFASKLGLPISTTHALIGAILGVGLARGIRALNLKTLKDIVMTWVITLPLCALLSISIYYLLKCFF